MCAPVRGGLYGAARQTRADRIASSQTRLLFSIYTFLGVYESRRGRRASASI